MPGFGSPLKTALDRPNLGSTGARLGRTPRFDYEGLRAYDDTLDVARAF